MKMDMILAVLGRVGYFMLGVVTCLFVFTFNANAGLMDSVATQGWPTKSTKRYKLDVYGYDARAYEFETDNGMKCIMVFPGGSAQGWQMECLPK